MSAGAAVLGSPHEGLELTRSTSAAGEVPLSRAPEGPAALMRRYQDDDATAFEQLYDHLRPQMRSMLVKIVGPDPVVDDLLQVTMMRAHVARHGFEPPHADADGAVVAWYLAIARNAAFSWLRRDRRRIVPMEDHGAAAAALVEPNTPETNGLAAERDAEALRRVRDAIDRLPAEQREVVELHKLQGMPFAEISRRLGVREGAARVRAHRAYRALAKLLTGGST